MKEITYPCVAIWNNGVYKGLTVRFYNSRTGTVIKEVQGFSIGQSENSWAPTSSKNWDILPTKPAFRRRKSD